MALWFLGALVLTGCSGGPGSGPTAPTASPGPPPTVSSPPPSSSPEPAPSTSFEFTDAADRVFTFHSANEPDVVAGTGGTFVTVEFRAPSETVLLTAPRGATWEIFADHSAVLRDPEATVGVVGGLLPPTAGDAAGERVRARLAAADPAATGNTNSSIPAEGDDSGNVDDPADPSNTETSDNSDAPDPTAGEPVTEVEIRIEPGPPAVFPVEVRLELGVSALNRVVWANDLEGGRSLQVFPTKWGRSGSQAAVVAVWDSMVGLEPGAETEVMHKQLRCHALGAPNKPSWNLEPWRPDVPYFDYLLSKCNPN